LSYNTPCECANCGIATKLGDRVADTGTIADGAKPRLPRGVRLTHNEAQGGWVLLAPERIFKADAIAVEILKRCTGETTFAAIVDDLATTFSAPRDRIQADVSKLLSGLAEKKLLEL
jgi:pyrroloquinoline quinone biosynthesis protein D